MHETPANLSDANSTRGDGALQNGAVDGGGGPSSEFIQQFTRSQRQLFLRILRLIPNPFDAEEVLQETNLVVWRKAADFTAGSNFLAWAGRIAHYEVLKFRERKHRDLLTFSDRFVEALAVDQEYDSQGSEERRLQLARCLAQLREQDRELIRRRYTPGETGKSLAEAIGRPANAVYQSLSRIRRTLLECLTRASATS